MRKKIVVLLAGMCAAMIAVGCSSKPKETEQQTTKATEAAAVRTVAETEAAAETESAAAETEMKEVSLTFAAPETEAELGTETEADVFAGTGTEAEITAETEAETEDKYSRAEEVLDRLIERGESVAASLDEAAGEGSEFSDLYGELKENLEQKKDDVTRKMDEAEEILDEIRDDAKQQLDEVSVTLSEKRGEASAYLLGKLKKFIAETEEEN